MKHEIAVSVIIPVYNAEKNHQILDQRYLDRRQDQHWKLLSLTMALRQHVNDN